MTNEEPMMVTQRQIDRIKSYGIPGADDALKALMKRGEIVLIKENGGQRERTFTA